MPFAGTYASTCRPSFVPAFSRPHRVSIPILFPPARARGGRVAKPRNGRGLCLGRGWHGMARFSGTVRHRIAIVIVGCLAAALVGSLTGLTVYQASASPFGPSPWVGGISGLTNGNVHEPIDFLCCRFRTPRVSR